MIHDWFFALLTKSICYDVTETLKPTIIRIKSQIESYVYLSTEQKQWTNRTKTYEKLENKDDDNNKNEMGIC